jgi:hypothetical protein
MQTAKRPKSTDRVRALTVAEYPVVTKFLSVTDPPRTARPTGRSVFAMRAFIRCSARHPSSLVVSAVRVAAAHSPGR